MRLTVDNNLFTVNQASRRNENNFRCLNMLFFHLLSQFSTPPPLNIIFRYLQDGEVKMQLITKGYILKLYILLLLFTYLMFKLLQKDIQLGGQCFLHLRCLSNRDLFKYSIYINIIITLECYIKLHLDAVSTSFHA